MEKGNHIAGGLRLFFFCFFSLCLGRLSWKFKTTTNQKPTLLAPAPPLAGHDWGRSYRTPGLKAAGTADDPQARADGWRMSPCPCVGTPPFIIGGGGEAPPPKFLDQLFGFRKIKPDLAPPCGTPP